MQVLNEGAVLIIMLILFLMTSSMDAIREEPSSIGIERKIPSGPDPIHNPPPPSPKQRHVIEVEEKHIQRSWNYEDYESPHKRNPIYNNSPQPSPDSLSFEWSRDNIKWNS
ncbi:PREDICTED: CLAVATA3/ESR (CLE)-related protein 18-like [Camelina sativa]|uniref:CLAVATA3/ESR (CLE)-related protein 18-like n=1 Tax=Camelina sativa TaxID=90675 RepID=A0ABM0WFN9_CAMSA|nr:PREDICTED: CLAVATA3/ESR (CLE)-related protein 18-like [Camelina sativa]